jgi:hypothetical protein
MAEARQQLGLQPSDHSRDDAIRASLDQALVLRNGRLAFRQSPQMAIVSWDKSP